MKHTDLATQTTLDILTEVEKELRNEINFHAHNLDYNKVVFGEGGVTIGDSVKSGLNRRWLNVLRLLSGLSRNSFDWMFVHRELGHQDLETLQRINKTSV